MFHPVSAIHSADVLDSDFEQIYEVGTRLLSDIESEKAMYGLSDVNFDNLYIGEYLPAYTATASGLIQSDTRYYPVLESGKWVATLTCVKSGNIWNGQISTAFVSDLPVISPNDNLSLIFDQSKTYLNKNGDMYEIASFNTVSNRSDIVITPAPAVILSAQKLMNKRAVEIDEFNSDTQFYSSVPIQKFLDVPLVSQQPYPFAC